MALTGTSLETAPRVAKAGAAAVGVVAVAVGVAEVDAATTTVAGATTKRSRTTTTGALWLPKVATTSNSRKSTELLGVSKEEPPCLPPTAHARGLSGG